MSTDSSGSTPSPTYGSTPLSVPITNGKGESECLLKVPPGRVLTCAIYLTAPPGGTWNLVAVNEENSRVAFQNSSMVINQVYSFTFHGTITTQLSITATWSQSGNTTLSGIIDYQF